MWKTEPWLKFVCIMRSGPDRRRYNQPTTDEVAAIYVGDFPVFSNDGKVRAIPITSPHCDPMTYPLLFPFGHLLTEHLTHARI